jgi:signal peptidase I
MNINNVPKIFNKNDTKVETVVVPLEPKDKFKDLLEVVKVVITALIITFILNNYIIVTAQVPTSSMENTVMTEDRILAFRLSYFFEEPKRGDIIVFPYPDDESVNYLKRIIGLPGETIEIIDGKIFIDGNSTPLKEEYLKEIPEGTYGPYKVPDDSYFMLGDNRNISMDSRYWENTFVEKDKIIGKAILSYYPKVHMLD